MKKEWTPEEKAAFAENAKVKADAAGELLKAGIADMYRSGRYDEFLKFYSGFHQYSFGNIVLIMMQNPEARYCASFADWKKKGRFVKKGEKGMMIRVPTPRKYKAINAETGEEEEHSTMHYKIGSVFDISQTDGDPLPDICRKLTGDVAGYDNIMAGIRRVSKVPVEITELKYASANGLYSHAENKIIIRPGLSQAQTVKTGIHELAHSILHGDDGEEKEASRQEKELQAESVAFIVCNYLGIDTSDYSFGYVAEWSADKSMRQLEKHMNVIGKTAKDIIAALEEK